MDLDIISTLVTFEHLNLMCRQAERPAVPVDAERAASQTVPPSPARTVQPSRLDVLSPPAEQCHNSPPSWDRRTEEALKDETVTCVPFCFQLPRLLPKCSRAKLLFSTFVQGN